MDDGNILIIYKLGITKGTTPSTFSPNAAIMEGHITMEELEKWLKWCTFPPTRVNADELLASLGLQAYNRWDIVRKTHGVMAV